jgi:MtfA peptidase
VFAYSDSGDSGDVILAVTVLLVVFAGIVFMVHKFKRGRTRVFDSTLNCERGRRLDTMLGEKEGDRLSDWQRRVIAENVGLYDWVPEELRGPWEERILVFLGNFPFSDMEDGPVSQDQRLLVAAEACLLIVNRRMSDYRHLQRIHLWKDKIKGSEDARGTATRHEVNLSWSHLKKTIQKARDGHNLTLHEFAHVIDFADDGVAQSIPESSSSPDYEEWRVLVEEEHKKLMKVYGSGKNYSIRAYGGYKSIQGDKPELFSCGTSAFFERSSRLLRECPRIYQAFKKFYGVDPAAWRKQKTG